MFLISNSQKELGESLILLGENFDDEIPLEEKLQHIRKLAIASLTHFNLKNSKVIPFSFPIQIGKLNFFGEQITSIMDKEDLEYRISQIIERIIRSLFIKKQCRETISIISQGDELLRQGLMKVFVYFSSCIDIKKNRIYVNKPISSYYLTKPYIFCLFFSFIQKGNIPIGKFKVYSSERETGDIPFELSEDGFIPFYLEAETKSVKQWEDQNVFEKMYNASIGIIHFLSLKEVEEIEKILIHNIGNDKLLKGILHLLLSSEYPSNLVETMIEIIVRTTEFLKVPLDDILLKMKYEGKPSLTSRTFYNILPLLENSTLVALTKPNPKEISKIENKSLPVTDEYGKLMTNIHSYIIEEQISRFSRMPVMDESLRSILNKLDFEDKQLLISIIFNDKYK
jgi:hypothetical protein